MARPNPTRVLELMTRSGFPGLVRLHRKASVHHAFCVERYTKGHEFTKAAHVEVLSIEQAMFRAFDGYDYRGLPGMDGES